MIEFKSVTKIYRSALSPRSGSPHASARGDSARAPSPKAARRPGPAPALDRLSLVIPTGSFVFVVGPSGAGKTSLARLITREEKATAGSILVDGFDIGMLNDAELPYYRRQLGIIFQDHRLFPTMTALENIAFAAIAVGEPMTQARRKAHTLLGRMGISDKASHFPGELSGGEAARVAIARSIINRPKIIIADEPTGNLDPALSLDIITLLHSVNAETSATVIVITHDIATVSAFKDTVIRLNRGKLEQ